MYLLKCWILHAPKFPFPLEVVGMISYENNPVNSKIRDKVCGVNDLPRFLSLNTMSNLNIMETKRPSLISPLPFLSHYIFRCVSFTLTLYLYTFPSLRYLTKRSKHVNVLFRIVFVFVIFCFLISQHSMLFDNLLI